MDSVRTPVITIDGPSGTGKGTVTVLLAKALGWHVLDSGAIYRAVAWAIMQSGVGLQNEVAIRDILATIDIELISETPEASPTVLCNGVDITEAIRNEKVGMLASTTSAFPYVRHAILKTQRDFRALPGLIADGRDMGTVIFPDATLKLYLDAAPEERIKRRFNELRKRGLNVTLAAVEESLLARDQQDAGRAIAPLIPAPDAHIIDTTGLNIEQVFAKVMEYVRQFVL